jgi:small multidrug resistance family-3 protein
VTAGALLAFPLAALFELLGCWLAWHWWRGGSAWLAPAALLCLAGFALLLALTPAAHAGRAFAAYGGVYLAASLAWLWLVDGRPPDRWDLLGGALALAGAGTVLLGPRG